MKQSVPGFARVALAAALFGVALSASAQYRDPVLALADRRATTTASTTSPSASTTARRSTRSVPVFKGTLSGSRWRPWSRPPCRQPAAHRPDLRGRHRHDDGVGQGDQARLRSDGRSAARSSTPRRTSRRWPATTPRRRARCCRSRSTARPRCSTTTRTRSRRPASIPIIRRRRGREVAAAIGRSCRRRGARSAPFTTGWPSWIQFENFQRMA